MSLNPRVPPRQRPDFAGKPARHLPVPTSYRPRSRAKRPLRGSGRPAVVGSGDAYRGVVVPFDDPRLGGNWPGVVTLPVADGSPAPLPAGFAAGPVPVPPSPGAAVVPEPVAPMLPEPVALPAPDARGVPKVPPDPVVPLGAIVPPEFEPPPDALPPAAPPELPPDWAYAMPAVAASNAIVRKARLMDRSCSFGIEAKSQEINARAGSTLPWLLSRNASAHRARRRGWSSDLPTSRR
jgi:hypothetical protein